MRTRFIKFMQINEKKKRPPFPSVGVTSLQNNEFLPDCYKKHLSIFISDITNWH